MKWWSYTSILKIMHETQDEGKLKWIAWEENELLLFQ